MGRREEKRREKMVSAFHVWKLSLVLSSLLPNSMVPPNWNSWGKSRSRSGVEVGVFPPTCTRIECPTYDLIEVATGYEIRRYNSTLIWISTSPISDISLVDATRDGFLQLFDYIQGKNEYQQQIEMTAPVITQVSPSDGPFCESSFVVSFYVPKSNQANPPPAKGLHVQKAGPAYAAVRQFSGFVSDSEVAQEAAALQASLAGSIWSTAIQKSDPDHPTSTYTVAQYNSPFEYNDRVNEIWILFDMEDEVGAGAVA